MTVRRDSLSTLPKPPESQVVTAGVEFLILPYASAEGRSLLSRLVQELNDCRWENFWGAIAFVNASGNDRDLLLALSKFVRRGGEVTLTLGADVFGASSFGTELLAVKSLLEALDGDERARIFLYHEKGRTFHPKLYIFSCEQEALVIIGSSNWTKGGLSENVEANALIYLDLSDLAQKAVYDRLVSTFEEYWTEK